MVRWFPDRRGFAAGVVAAGYGMGAIADHLPDHRQLAASGLPATLLQFGLIFGAVGVLAALGLRRPPAPARARGRRRRGVGTGEMLRNPIFWLMFVMMTLMSTSGLMVTSQIGTFAADFGITKMMVWGMAALPLALTVDRFTNGLTRPFFGWVSDRIGRENTMFLAFALEGIAMTVWLLRAPTRCCSCCCPAWCSSAGARSSRCSLHADRHVRRPHATQNYGCLYIAQGIGAIFGGPLAVLLHDATGSWTPVFAVAIAADLLTAVLAIAVLKPMRRRLTWLALDKLHSASSRLQPSSSSSLVDQRRVGLAGHRLHHLADEEAEQLVLAARYSATLSGLAASTLSIAASIAPVSVTWRRPRASTIAAGVSPVSTIASNTSLAMRPVMVLSAIRSISSPSARAETGYSRSCGRSGSGRRRNRPSSSWPPAWRRGPSATFS